MEHTLDKFLLEQTDKTTLRRYKNLLHQYRRQIIHLHLENNPY